MPLYAIIFIAPLFSPQTAPGRKTTKSGSSVSKIQLSAFFYLKNPLPCAILRVIDDGGTHPKKTKLES